MLFSLLFIQPPHPCKDSLHCKDMMKTPGFSSHPNTSRFCPAAMLRAGRFPALLSCCVDLLPVLRLWGPPAPPPPLGYLIYRRAKDRCISASPLLLRQRYVVRLSCMSYRIERALRWSSLLELALELARAVAGQALQLPSTSHPFPRTSRRSLRFFPSRRKRKRFAEALHLASL